MPRLPFPDYLDHLRGESARFREVLADCDPGARVPGCPDWDAAELLWHLAGVQLFWAKVVRHRPTAPDDIDEPEAERPGTYAELLQAFDDYSHALVTELERADPADEAWHWSDDHTVGTSYRRQAHEALIHRVDAQEAAGVPVTPLSTDLADDGVAEVLGVMYGGSVPWGTFTPSDHRVSVEMTDTGTTLTVALGTFDGTDPDSGQTYSDEPDLHVVDSGDAPAAVRVTGTAADLDTWLWKRGAARGLSPRPGADTPIRVEGDQTAFDQFLAVIGQPIN